MATSMKLAILLCAAVVAVFAQAAPVEDFDVEEQELSHIIAKRAAPKDQTRIYGSQGPFDRLLHLQVVDVKKGILQVKKADVTYPADHTTNGPIITCIKVLDQFRNGKNAEVKVGSGGVGQRFTIINMKGQRGEPIKYIVQIYGR